MPCLFLGFYAIDNNDDISFWLNNNIMVSDFLFLFFLPKPVIAWFAWFCYGYFLEVCITRLLIKFVNIYYICQINLHLIFYFFCCVGGRSCCPKEWLFYVDSIINKVGLEESAMHKIEFVGWMENRLIWMLR